MEIILCPQCGQPVNVEARYCDHCQVDLAIAAVRAEREMPLPGTLPEGVPVTPEILVPRLGDYLVDQGAVTPEELERALAYQAEKARQGTPLLLGQAFRELNIISKDVLDQAVTVQILQLQTALRETNQELEERVQQRTQELAKALEKLTDLNQLKANFIANISHELRTPLAHIKGYVDLLAQEELGSLNTSQKNAIGVLNRAEERLERLIEDLIQFSLVSRGKLHLNRALIRIPEMLRVVISQATQKARAGGLRLEVHFPEDLPDVFCDAEKIAWVVGQLLDNAIKFSPGGDVVNIAASADGSFVTISVRDTGIGIPPDRLDEIYEPFHQLDSSSTRRYGGTGLGLAFCSRILAAHATSLTVESQVGKGSRFEFKLSTQGNLEPAAET